MSQETIRIGACCSSSHGGWIFVFQRCQQTALTDLSVTLGNISLTLQRTTTTLIQVRHVLSLLAKGFLLLRTPHEQQEKNWARVDKN